MQQYSATTITELSRKVLLRSIQRVSQIEENVLYINRKQNTYLTKEHKKVVYIGVRKSLSETRPNERRSF